MGNGGKETGAAAQGSPRRAEQKDRPLASMPDNKRRYTADDDGRDDAAKSYFEKNRKDEARFDKEPSADRPITKELQEKMPKLSRRQLLLTRLAGLATVLAAEASEAERLHLKRRTYEKDEAQDMDFAGAAGRTQSEINKEHGQRSSETGSLSPMMSRLWSAYGPVRTAAASEAFKGKIDEGGDKKKQVGEMQKAIKGMKSEDKGAEAAMGAMEKKVESMESDVAKKAGINLGLKSVAAISIANDRLAVIRAALSDVARLCRASHVEVRFALEKPHGTGVSDGETSILEELGETAEDMADVVDKHLKEMGHPGLKKRGPEDGKPGAEGLGAPEPKGPPMGGADEGFPGGAGGAGAEEGAPAKMPGMEAGATGRVKTALEVEDEGVERVAADANLSAEGKKAKVAELRGSAKWSAVFSKGADAASSNWQVSRQADGKSDVVLKVSLSDAYPVKSGEERKAAYAWFATTDYGRQLLNSAKYEGLGKTARLLGLANVRTAAGAFDEYSTKRPAAPAAALEGGKIDESSYYAKAYGSPEFASEILKDHSRKAAAVEAGLKAKIAALEGEKKAEAERNDRLQNDIAMRARASKALELAQEAVSKGVIGAEHKASFIDKLMVGDESAFALASSMVGNFKRTAAPVEAADGEIVRSASANGSTSVRDLLRSAAAGPGLKTAIVSAPSAPSGLEASLANVWRVPPTVARQ